MSGGTDDDTDDDDVDDADKHVTVDSAVGAYNFISTFIAAWDTLICFKANGISGI
jgi:hypothetical protein